MSAFYEPAQIDIIKPYFDKFFVVLLEQYEKTGPMEFGLFFKNMLPKLDA